MARDLLGRRMPRAVFSRTLLGAAVIAEEQVAGAGDAVELGG
jgi:hypothetical protein